MTATNQTLFEKLLQLRERGYKKLSLTELSHETDLNEDVLLAQSHTAGFKIVTMRSERFVMLDTLPIVAQNCDLPRPRSAILREVD